MTTLRIIGNSKGVLIPKPLLEQAGLEGHELLFELKEDGLLIKPVKHARANWQQKIKTTLHAHQHDVDSEWLNSQLTGDDYE